MKRYYEKLRQAAEEHPLEALAIGAAAVTATAKLLSAANERKNAETWRREVERRKMMTR